MQQATAKRFEDLQVWQKAHSFTLAAYRYSAGFPKTEVYGLMSQLRRAAVSISANIAEGFRRRSKVDKARMLNIAQGSLAEVQYYLLLAQDLGYGPSGPLRQQIDEVGRLLDAYVNAIRSSV